MNLHDYLGTLLQAENWPRTLTTLVLILLQIFLLPKGDRRTLLATLVLFFLHVVFLAIAELFPRASAAERALGTVSFFFVICCMGRSIFMLMTRTAAQRLLGKTPKIFLDIIHGLVYVIAVIVTLSFAGVEPSSLLTGSALLTAILGLSLRDTLGNVFAGLAIQAQNPFEVNDWIQYDDVPSHIGKVKEINWRATKVETLDKVEIIIPNSMLGQGHIVNFTRPDKWARRSIYFHAPYNVPPQRVHHLVLGALKDTWGVLKEPPPSIVTYDFDERGVKYWLRYFTVELDKRDGVDSAVRDRIWYALHRESILFPAPLRSIELHDVTEQKAQENEENTEVLDRIETLGCVDFLGSLSEEVLQQLGSLSRRRLYAPSEIIIQQGDQGDELFIIKRGEVVINVEGEGGRSVEVSRLGPRKFFGEMSLLTGEPRTATVKASHECELLIVDKHAFRQVLEDHPDVAEDIANTIAERQQNLSVKQSEAESRKGESKQEWRSVLVGRIRKFFDEK